MSNYYDELRARIADLWREIHTIESANLFPIGGSVDAACMVTRELHRQIDVYEEILRKRCP